MTARHFVLILSAAVMLQGCAAANRSGRDAPRLRETAVPSAPSDSGITAQTQASLYISVVEGLVKQERYGAALAFLDRYAVKQKDSTPRYWLLRGNALVGLGRAAEAASAYGRLDATPLAAEGWDGKGRAAASRQQWRVASAEFRKAVQANPSNAEFLNNLAYAGMQLGQNDASVAHLRQAHELSPGSTLIRNNLIIALTMAGDRNGAAGLLAGIPDAAQRQHVQKLVRRAAASKPKTDGKS